MFKYFRRVEKKNPTEAVKEEIVNFLEGLQTGENQKKYLMYDKMCWKPLV